MSKKITEWRYYQGMPVGNLNEIMEAINDIDPTPGSGTKWDVISIPDAGSGTLTAEDLAIIQTNNFVIITIGSEGVSTSFQFAIPAGYNVSGENVSKVFTELNVQGHPTGKTVIVSTSTGEWTCTETTLATANDLDYKLNVLPNEEGSQQPYNIPYHISDLSYDVAERKIKGTLHTITLDNLETIKTFPLEVAIPADATKLDATKCTLLTTAPTEAATDGGVHIVYLTAEPANKYDGYIYLIKE